MQLKDCAEPLALDIAFWMGGLDDSDYPIDQLGRLSLDLSEKLRSVGIILLLTNADSDGFFHNLIRSGISRRKYLERVHAVTATDDHHFASGRYEPLLDALAADAFDLAREIARLSPSAWRAQREYEDDHCYAQILHRLIQRTVAHDEIETLIEQFEAYLDGDDDTRLEICRALATSDQDRFDDAFQAMLEGREAQITVDKERGQLEEPKTVAQRHIFVEGLAILRVGEYRGLSSSREYPLCPSLARVPMRVPFPDL